MTEVDTAIMTLFNSTSGSPTPVHNSLYLALYDTSISSLPRFFNEEAQQTTGMANDGMPFVVFHNLSDVYEFQFREDFENILIQFTIRAKTIGEINSIYTKLDSLFNWCDLSVSGYTHVYMRREQTHAKGKTDLFWSMPIDYRIYIEKT